MTEIATIDWFWGHLFSLKTLLYFIFISQLMEVLDQDPVSMRMQLSVKLGTVITAMEGPNSGRLAFV